MTGLVSVSIFNGESYGQVRKVAELMAEMELS